MAKRRETQTSVTVWLDPEQVDLLDGLKGAKLSRSGYVTRLLARHLDDIAKERSSQTGSTRNRTTTDEEGGLKRNHHPRRPAIVNLPARPAAFGPHGHRETASEPLREKMPLSPEEKPVRRAGQRLRQEDEFTDVVPDNDHQNDQPAAAPATDPEHSVPAQSPDMILDTGNIDETMIQEAIFRLRNRVVHARVRRPPLSVRQLVEAVTLGWEGWDIESLANRYNVAAHIVAREIAEVESELRKMAGINGSPESRDHYRSA